MGSRDLITLQSGVKPLEGAWSQGTSVGSGLLGLREDQGVWRSTLQVWLGKSERDNHLGVCV